MVKSIVSDGIVKIEISGDPLSIISEGLATIHFIYDAIKKKDEVLAQAFLEILSDHTEEIVTGAYVTGWEPQEEKPDIDKLDEVSAQIDAMLELLKHMRNDK